MTKLHGLPVKAPVIEEFMTRPRTITARITHWERWVRARIIVDSMVVKDQIVKTAMRSRRVCAAPSHPRWAERCSASWEIAKT